MLCHAVPTLLLETSRVLVLIDIAAFSRQVRGSTPIGGTQPSLNSPCQLPFSGLAVAVRLTGGNSPLYEALECLRRAAGEACLLPLVLPTAAATSLANPALTHPSSLSAPGNGLLGVQQRGDSRDGGASGCKRCFQPAPGGHTAPRRPAAASQRLRQRRRRCSLHACTLLQCCWSWRLAGPHLPVDFTRGW